MANVGTDDDHDVALRCRVLTRLYAGGNSTAFADTIGISPNRWNNIENNGALSKDVAFTIVRKFPEISLDWLWRGKDDGLPRLRADELAETFRQVVRTIPAAPPKRKRATS